MSGRLLAVRVTLAAALGLFAVPALAESGSRGAAEVVPLGPEAPPIDASTAPKNRSYLQAAMNKVRPGAMLKADVPPYSPPPELRGRLARARDEAVQAHYARIAEMDYLADGAAKEHDGKLAERIETTRRHEIQRFFRQMQWLRTQVLSFWERRLP